jgi:hypothetical protein
LQIKDLQARVELLSGDHDERQEAISLLIKNLLTEKYVHQHQYGAIDGRLKRILLS